jgi:RNA polymerase sigma factor (sigma-70 family)
MDEVRLLMLKLRRLLRSRGRSIDDTDDLIQEAFLRLQLYCRDSKVKVEQTEAFLVRTALNLSVDQHRRAQVAGVVSGGLDSMELIDPQPSPDAVCAAQDRLRHMKAGLANLSPRQREVFLLNRVEGFSFPQIAKELGVSMSMVEKHAAKAVLSMTNWMNDEQN